ncbi:MAG: cysteine/glutathione ABC transporter ATP-binding protein/permease CydC [Desulfobacteraceae bacterium]|nr:cysteine/glutathione ABC transporter ATP-binding protein/permease CydC [Desulfobacteraceae bacterium]
MKALIPFIKLFKHQWVMMLTGLFLSVLTLIAGIALLSLSGWFLSAAAVAGLTIAATQAFNYFTPAGGVRILSMLRTASRYGERLATHEATFRLLTSLRVWAWRKILPLSARNMQSLRQGELLNRLVSDIDTLDHIYLRLITPVLSALIMTGCLYLFVFWIDVSLANLLCISLLLIWLTLPLVFYFLGKKPGINQIKAKRLLRVRLLEFVQGFAEISLFCATDSFREKIEKSESELLESQCAMANVMALSQAVLIMCHGSLVVIVLYSAASGIGEHQPPGPMLALTAFMVLACIEMLMPVSAAFQHVSACINAAERINELVNQKPDIEFNDESTAVITTGNLQLKNIEFSYNKETGKVLKNISLSLRPGEKTALLGKTGCGKSTLLSMITREWEPDSGSIFLDSENIKEYSQKALRQGISLMSQRIYLFSGTLRSNLTLAQPDSPEYESVEEQKEAEKQNDKYLIEVLEKVGLSALTKGENPLDTWIGEGGRQLSGGEQRRIGVARVLLRNAPLLLLDEPTEGLDKRTEREILSLLFEFAADKSLLMISHRLTAMPEMDRIYLMEDGVLRAFGSHDDLLAKDEYYRSLYRQLN